MKRLWQRLVTDNPMMGEVGRFKRRFTGGGSTNPLYKTLLTVSAVAYLCFLIVVGTYGEDFDPSAFIMLQTGAFALLIPLVGHGMIAGERDRRSWDMLMAAPLTKAQVVVGKLATALAGMGVIFVAFLIPTLIVALISPDPLPNQELLSQPLSFAALEWISITYGVFTCALTLFISSRCKRSHSALGTSITVQALLLVGLPLLAAVVYFTLFPSAGPAEDIAFLHPFISQGFIIDGSIPRRYDISTGIVIGPAFYLVAAGFLTFWTQKTVTHADGDRRLQPTSNA